MNAERLLDHYARIAEAPDAVARLRRLVLDLAVRGKLVPQDAADEPASALLLRIAAERSLRAARGEIKRPKALTPIQEEPFAIPPTWCWVRMREVTSDRGQTVPAGEFTYIDVSCIDKERGIVGTPSILKAEEAPSRARKVIRKGDVIYSCVRPYLLNVAVVEDDHDPPAIASTAFAVLDAYGLIIPRFLWVTLRSPFMVAEVERTQRGQAYPAINDADFALLPLPLPPLAEQHRIVAKVDELMALCDQLEAARATREARRDRLAAASLARLDTPDPETFPEDASFVLSALPALTTRRDQMKHIRQTILNLAVRGKLVDQRPSDGAAPRIDLALTEVSAPFDLPQSWTWARIRKLGQLKGGGTPSKTQAEFWDGDIPWVSPKDMKLDYIDEAQLAITKEAVEASAVTLLPPRSLLFVVRGMILAHSFPVAVCRVWATINQDMKALVPAEPEMADYLLHALKGLKAEMLERVQRSTHGTCRIEGAAYADFPVPIPPLAEQRRIVAKVNELMELCDALEASLAAASTARTRLFAATLAEALAPAHEQVLEAAE